MEHIVHVSEVSPPIPSSMHQSESLTKKTIDSPVATQVSHDYSLLSNHSETRLPPLKQEIHPMPVERKIANAAPLGLCAFALTSFLTNCINLGVGNVQAAGASVSLALIYGGLVQILVGMWYVIRMVQASALVPLRD